MANSTESIFENFFSSILEKLPDAIDEQIAEALFDALMGNSDQSVEIGMLQDIYNELQYNTLLVQTVSYQTNYYNDYNTAKAQLAAVTPILTYTFEQLNTPENWNALVNFLQQGAINSNTYSYFMDKLMNDCYGVGIAECFGKPAPLPPGSYKGGYGYALDQFWLGPPIGLNDYITNHLNFALALSAQMLALFQCAQKAEALMANALTQPAGVIDAVSLSNITQILNNPTTSQYLTPNNATNTVGSPNLMVSLFAHIQAAIADICGPAFQLYQSLVNNDGKTYTFYNVVRGSSCAIGYGRGTYTYADISNAVPFTLTWNDQTNNLVKFTNPSSGATPAYTCLMVYENLSNQVDQPNIIMYGNDAQESDYVSRCYWQIMLINANNVLWINNTNNGQAVADCFWSFPDSDTRHNEQLGCAASDQGDADQRWVFAQFA